MEKNVIVPPHFQHPNYYVDVLDEYLTAEESKVLTHAAREILGWRDSLQTRQKHIARDVFLNGRAVNGKKVYGGVNLCKEAIENALDALHQYRILIKSGSPRDPRGQLYELTEDVSQIDIAGLIARKQGKKAANKTRLNKSSSNKGHTRLSHRPVNSSPVEQASYSPIAQASKSPVEQASYSPVRQAERKTRSERHNEKDIKREREAAKPNSSDAGTNALALSSSPSGTVYLSFFKGECERLNQHQINAISGITDTALLKSAIEYLLQSGVQELWKKIPLIKTKMQELAAAASLPVSAAGAGGAASPAVLTLAAKPAVTVKSLERRANLDKIAALRSSVADVIDVESRTFNALGV